MSCLPVPWINSLVKERNVPLQPYISWGISDKCAGPSGRTVKGVGLWPLARGFKYHRGHGCLCVVSVVCCQVEVSAMS